MNNFLNYNINLHKYIFNNTFNIKNNTNNNTNNNNTNNKNNKISINKISKILNTAYFKKLKQTPPKLSLESAGQWEKEHPHALTNTAEHRKYIIRINIENSSVPVLHGSSRISW
jgi:hypothetical protein